MLLKGPPRKNQTKMIFFRQGSIIEILSIFAYKLPHVRLEMLCNFLLQIRLYIRERRNFRFHLQTREIESQ